MAFWQHVPPQSAFFKHLASHESCSMTPAFTKRQNGQDAAAPLSVKHKALMCSNPFVMKRLFNAVVRPPISFGVEMEAPAC